MTYKAMIDKVAKQTKAINKEAEKREQKLLEESKLWEAYHEAANDGNRNVTGFMNCVTTHINDENVSCTKNYEVEFKKIADKINECYKKICK